MGGEDFPYTDEQLEVLHYLSETLNYASLPFSLFVTFTFLFFKRGFPSSLALCYSVCSSALPFLFLISSSFFSLEQVSNSVVLCHIQGMGLQFFGNCLTWWWLCIGANLYVTVVLEVPNPKRFLPVYHVIGWGIPLIQTVLPLFFDLYGPASLFWCWIEDSRYHMWQFFNYYFEMALCVAIGLIMWFRVIVVAWRLHREAGDGSFFQTYLYRHLLFVLLFVALFSVELTDRVFEAFFTGDPGFYLSVVHVSANSCQGLITFIAFGTSKATWMLWVNFFERLIKGEVRMDDCFPCRAWAASRSDATPRTLSYSRIMDTSRSLSRSSIHSSFGE